MFNLLYFTTLLCWIHHGDGMKQDLRPFITHPAHESLFRTIGV